MLRDETNKSGEFAAVAVKNTTAERVHNKFSHLYTSGERGMLIPHSID